MNAAAFEGLVTALVRDDDGRLSPGEVSGALELVINRYNSQRPLEVIEDLQVGANFVIETPESWIPKRSRICSIEYPVGNHRPTYINEDFYYVYDLPAADVELRLVPGTATVGSEVRVAYTTNHTSAETFHDDDCEALAYLGASILCDQLASIYGHQSDSSVQADSVEHGDKGRLFASRSRDFRARYETKFGKPTSTQAASTVVTVNSRSRPGMYHR